MVIYRIVRVENDGANRVEVMRVGLTETQGVSELRALEEYAVSRSLFDTRLWSEAMLCSCRWKVEIGWDEESHPYLAYDLERPCVLHIMDYVRFDSNEGPTVIEELYRLYDLEREAAPTLFVEKYQAEEVADASPERRRQYGKPT
jgi:hypothetical protein